MTPSVSYVPDEVIERDAQALLADHPFVEIARFERDIPGTERTVSVDQALDSFAKPFAEQFLVSPIVMRIRLEKLGLLHRVEPGQRLLEKLDQLAAGTFK